MSLKKLQTKFGNILFANNMNINIIKYSFIITLLFQFNNDLLCQDVKKIDGFAINPKIGPAFSVDGGNDIPSMGIEFNILKNKFIYSIDYIGHDILAALILNDASQNQLGIMMGKYRGDKYFRIQYQAGINILWGEYSSPGGAGPWIGFGGPNTSFFAVGAVSKVGFKFIPSRNLSIGLDLLINLNFEKSMFIPMFSIEIGKLKNTIESHSDN